MLTFTDGGNWLQQEAEPSHAVYRARMTEWARNYSQACYNFARHGKIAAPGALRYTIEDAKSVWLPGYEPKPEQVEALLLGINFGRFALFGTMGFGKTPTTGGVMAFIQQKGGLVGQQRRKFAVFCPKSVIDEWVTQPLRFFGQKTAVFPGGNVYDADIIVTNYEQAANLYAAHKNVIGGVVLDESHKVKNIHTQVFDHIQNMMYGVFYRFVLTGTPQTKDPQDMFTQLSVINPMAFPFSYGYMLDRHYSMINYGKFSKLSFRKKDAPIFRDIAARNAIAPPAEGAAVEAKKTLIPVRMNAVQSEMMDKTTQANVTIVRDAGALGYNVSTQEIHAAVIKECQISSGYLIAEDAPIRFESTKLSRIVDDVNTEWSGQRAIVWVFFRETAERLLRTFGKRATLIYGGMSNKARKEALERFEQESDCVLVAQIKTANAGLNLQFCKNMAFAELDWAHVTIDQAVARVDRRGQKDECDIRFYYTEGTADELMLLAYKDKQRVSSQTLVNYIAKNNVVFSQKNVKRERTKKSAMDAVINSDWTMRTGGGVSSWLKTT